MGSVPGWADSPAGSFDRHTAGLPRSCTDVVVRTSEPGSFRRVSAAPLRGQQQHLTPGGSQLGCAQGWTQRPASLAGPAATAQPWVWSVLSRLCGRPPSSTTPVCLLSGLGGEDMEAGWAGGQASHHRAQPASAMAPTVASRPATHNMAHSDLSPAPGANSPAVPHPASHLPAALLQPLPGRRLEELMSRGVEHRAPGRLAPLAHPALHRTLPGQPPPPAGEGPPGEASAADLAAASPSQLNGMAATKDSCAATSVGATAQRLPRRARSFSRSGLANEQAEPAARKAVRALISRRSRSARALLLADIVHEKRQALLAAANAGPERVSKDAGSAAEGGSGTGRSSRTSRTTGSIASQHQRPAADRAPALTEAAHFSSPGELSGLHLLLQQLKERRLRAETPPSGFLGAGPRTKSFRSTASRSSGSSRKDLEKSAAMSRCRRKSVLESSLSVAVSAAGLSSSSSRLRSSTAQHRLPHRLEKRVSRGSSSVLSSRSSVVFRSRASSRRSLLLRRSHEWEADTDGSHSSVGRQRSTAYMGRHEEGLPALLDSIHRVQHSRSASRTQRSFVRGPWGTERSKPSGTGSSSSTHRPGVEGRESTLMGRVSSSSEASEAVLEAVNVGQRGQEGRADTRPEVYERLETQPWRPGRQRQTTEQSYAR
ncbi:hypothetical protein V8C86DRAFT_2586613 [Haematococcus lacustris]